MTIEELDAVTWKQFEQAVCDLMVRDGIQAEHVGGKGDMAADVLGHDPATGKTWLPRPNTMAWEALSARPDIQMVVGTASGIHGDDVAVVVTNRSFTRDARQVASALRIHPRRPAPAHPVGGRGSLLHQVLDIPPGKADSQRFTA